MIIVVGVLTFNNTDAEIRRFLTSYRVATQRMQAAVAMGIECNLFFSDNGKASAFRESEATEIPSKGNFGFGHGINRMMEAAFVGKKADFFIMANPDGSFAPDALTALTRAYLENKRALIEADQFPESNAKGFLNDKLANNKLECSWASGCCLLVPRAIYERIGGFDEEFFMYMEDVDFSWRARAEGFSVRACPDALYEHSVMGRRMSDQTKRFVLESTRYFGWKWRSRYHYRACSRQLLEEGLVESGALPDLTSKKRMPRLKVWKVSDFKHRWAYGPLRWENT